MIDKYPVCDCPYCKKPTKQKIGFAMTTSLYYPPIIDTEGNNVNPDGNITTETRHCIECNREFQVRAQYGQIIEIENVDRKSDNDPWWIKYKKEDK